MCGEDDWEVVTSLAEWGVEKSGIEVWSTEVFGVPRLEVVGLPGCEGNIDESNVASLNL